MAAPLSLTRTRVATPADVYERVSILVRQNHALVRRGRTVLAEDDVDRVEQTDRRTWTLTTTSGETWTVSKLGGCNCGGT